MEKFLDVFLCHHALRYTSPAEAAVSNGHVLIQSKYMLITMLRDSRVALLTIASVQPVYRRISREDGSN